MEAAASTAQQSAVEEIFQRITSDLSMLADREITVRAFEVTRQSTRPAGPGQIHLSFRFGVEQGEALHHGTLLVPLPTAVALGCFLMMLPEETSESRRALETLDESLKDAMLEIGNFVAGAVDAALRALDRNVSRVRFEGCQGVRADVRPALVYSEGAPLVVGTASVAVADDDPCQMVLLLPAGDYLSR